MKVTLELSEGQLKVLEAMGDIYGASMKDRVQHILVDILAAKKRELEPPMPTSTIYGNLTFPATGTGTVIC